MLNQNDRLTYQTPWRYEEGAPDLALGGVYGYSTNYSPKAIIERLGEYEDTGYKPEEIKCFLSKYITRIGDYVEYLGTIYEVIGFSHNIVHNIIQLQSVNDDRYHEADLPVYLFSVDYHRKDKL